MERTLIEETTKEYYRLRLRAAFSDESSFHFALVQIRSGDEEERRMTWCLELKDISPAFALTLGHFYAHFGTGLLAGRQSPYNHDAFRVRGEARQREAFSPAVSGNPYFALHGAACRISQETEDWRLALNGFYSMKKRYIQERDYERGATIAGLGTIDAREHRSYPATEAVEIHTSGGGMSLSYRRLFHLEAYGLTARLKSPGGDTVLFDYDSLEEEESGIRRYSGGGVTLAYRDDYLLLFTELCASRRDYQYDDGTLRPASGKGRLSGVRIRHPLFKTSLVYKNTDPLFYAPYGTSLGDYTAERALFTDFTLTPYRNLRTGAACSSEEKKDYAPRNDERSLAERQRAFAEYRYGPLKGADLDWNRIRRNQDGEREVRNRCRFGLKLSPAEPLVLSVSTLHQYSRGQGPSRLHLGGLSLRLFRCLTQQLVYARGLISEGNAVYSPLLPLQSASAPGTRVEETSHIIVAKTAWVREGIYLSLRYLRQFEGDRILNQSLELFGSGHF